MDRASFPPVAQVNPLTLRVNLHHTGIVSPFPAEGGTGVLAHTSTLCTLGPCRADRRATDGAHESHGFVRTSAEHQGRVFVRPIDGAFNGERTLLAIDARSRF